MCSSPIVAQRWPRPRQSSCVGFGKGSPTRQAADLESGYTVHIQSLMATAGGSRCLVRADRGPSNLQRQSPSAIGTGTFWPPPTATCRATLAATSAATLGKALPQGRDAGGKGAGSYINARRALSTFRELDATHTSVSTVNARSAVWSSPAGYPTSRLWRAGSRGRPVARCSPGGHQGHNT
jgi:hypothetical protein